MRVLVHFFFTAAHFQLGGRKHFLFSHRCYKIFMLFFQQKKSLLCLLSLALFLVELRWPVAYFLFFSVFQICGHDNKSKLNTLDNTVTETISAFRFRLY